MYSLAVLFFDCLRFSVLMSSVHQRSDKDLRKAMAFVMSKCYLGDWFVLNQVSLNLKFLNVGTRNVRVLLSPFII